MLEDTPTRPGGSAAADAQPQTMADLILCIEADTDLAESRRRNIASSLRRFCVALGYDPTSTAASFPALRAGLKDFRPEAAGIKRKRWQTIRSDVAFALARGGIASTNRRVFVPHAPAWAAFKADLDPDKFRWRLSRFARHCAERGLAPEDVNDEVMDAYGEDLRASTFKAQPERLHRAVARMWNNAVAAMPARGLKVVTLPSHRELYTLPWENLPDSFRHEADTWLDSMSQKADIFSDEGRIKPLRPASIKAYRYALSQIVAALVAKGYALDTIDSLTVLANPATAKDALGFFVERYGGPAKSMNNIAHVLVLVAKAVKACPEAIKKLERFRKQVAPRTYGMSKRPKNALRPFVDKANIETLLMLPLRIFARLQRKPVLTLADARLMQVAVALELLLMRPIRRFNLVRLQLDRHVIQAGTRTVIFIPGEEVKNDVELDYAIPTDSDRLLRFYVANLLPMFGPNPDRFLFPGEKPNSAKSDEQFGRYFTKVIQQETGLRVYPHLMRHFAANLYLTEHPGAFETVRRLLAHKSLSTTTRSYVNFEDAAAVRLFDTLVNSIRSSISKEVRNG